MTEAPTSVTIVLLPPERELDLLELAKEWTSAWLIRSAIWVRTEDLIPDQGPLEAAPPRVSATILGRNGTATVTLFDELSRREYDLVRFVAVRSVEFGSDANDSLDDVVRSLEEHLKVSKPTATTIQFINVIVAPSKQAGASAQKLVEAGWNINVIASPEDRRSANSFDAFTRHSDRGQWAGFVLAHTVTAAGLWATIPSGPYDEKEFDGFMEGTHVQRVSIRGVLTGALVVNVGLQAMQMAAQDSSPLNDPLIAIGDDDLRVMTPEEEAQAVSELVGVTLSLGGGQLAYRNLPDPPRLEPLRLGFLQQVSALRAFAWDKVKETPEWTSRLLRRRVSSKATAELHGQGSDVQVDAQGILSWDDAQLYDAVAALNSRREEILAEFDAPVIARRHDIDGLLFESVRQSCFALLDGSELPQGHVMRTVWSPENRSPIVTSVSRIVPDWAHTWSPSPAIEQAVGSFSQVQGEPTNWLDVEFAKAWDDELARRESRLSERESALRHRLGEWRSRIQRNAEALEEAALIRDSLSDEVDWLREDLAAYDELTPGGNDPSTLGADAATALAASAREEFEGSPGAEFEGSPGAEFEGSPGAKDSANETPEAGDTHALTVEESESGVVEEFTSGESLSSGAERDKREVSESRDSVLPTVEEHSGAADHGAHNGDGAEGASSFETIDGAIEDPDDVIAVTETESDASQSDVPGPLGDPVLDEMRESLREREQELVEASREEARVRREREQLRAREDRTTAALGRVEEQVGLLHECRDSLRAWVAERSGSFTWQLLLRLSQERQKAQSEFQLLREAAQTPIDPGVQRPSTMQDRFMRQALISLTVVVVAWLTVVVLKYSVPDLATVAPGVNPIAWPVWMSAVVAAGAFCGLWILFLISYYRENSRSRHLLRQVSAYVEYLGATSLTAREEIQRLEALHSQVPDYLRYLSEAVHRPWELPAFKGSASQGTHDTPSDTPESLVFSATRLRADLLPSFMRLAESAPGAGGEKESALVRDTVRSLMHRGWRYGALCDLLSAAEEAASLPAGTFDPTRLDRDPRIREAFMSTLDQSEARLIAGRNQLRVLAQRIQLQVMDEIHPPVQDLADDPLRDLEIDEDLLGATDWRLKEWDEFLAEALTAPSNWSSLAFSIEGLAQGVEDVTSTGYGPERLIQAADTSVNFRGVAEKSTRPVELVVRVDRSTSSRGPGAYRVFSGVGMRQVANDAVQDSLSTEPETTFGSTSAGVPSTEDSLA